MHSISPAMQNSALRARGFRDWRYEKLALPPDKMETMINAVRADECVGANVTIPHKQSIIPFLDELSDTARGIGAVNTIVKRANKLIGENTDAEGFLESLRTRHIRPRHTHVMIFGAGGAAAAVAFALAREGARQIVLINRTTARAAELADHLHELFPRLEIAVNWWEPLCDMNLVVNASAVGMSPNSEESPLPSGRVVPRGALVYDLVYNPSETRFLKEAAHIGARCVGGLEMLINQGALSFELWTGREAPVRTMWLEAKRALDQQFPKQHSR
jgi:shikimate dehydrogenase